MNMVTQHQLLKENRTLYKFNWICSMLKHKPKTEKKTRQSVTVLKEKPDAFSVIMTEYAVASVKLTTPWALSSQWQFWGGRGKGATRDNLN